MISNFCCEPPCVSVLWDTYTVSVLWESDWPGEQKTDNYFLLRHIWPTPSKAKGARKEDNDEMGGQNGIKRGPKGPKGMPRGAKEAPLASLALSRWHTDGAPRP